MKPKKPPKRPPANVDTNKGTVKTYYKDDNVTVDYIIITKKDGKKESKRKK